MIVQSKKVKKIFQTHNKRASETCRTVTNFHRKCNWSLRGEEREKGSEKNFK